jgi:hypothetical protein
VPPEGSRKTNITTKPCRGTMNEKAVTVFVALLAFSLLTWSIVAKAKPITEAEKRHCEEAYHKYCGQYGLESNAPAQLHEPKRTIAAT